MEPARNRQYRSGVTLRPEAQPQGSEHRERHAETTADGAQSTGKATADDPRRPAAIGFVSQDDGVLAASAAVQPDTRLRWNRNLFRRY